MRGEGTAQAARKTAALLVALLLACSAPHALAQQSPAETILEFRVNDQTDTETLIARRLADGTLLLDAESFERLRLIIPTTAPLGIDGQTFYAVNAIRGVRIDFDESRQLVTIQAPPAAFLGTELALADAARPDIELAAPGAFLNYQVNGDRYDSIASIGAYAEVGTYGPIGVLTNTVIGSSAEGADSAVRLETTFTHDFPSSLHTLRVGDAITDAGAWGRPLRFGGIQFGTNFSVRPDLITTPLVSAGGNAVVPSTVDVFINNQQVTSQQVPPGPFVIDRLPAMTGAGNVQLVVRDALGREQLINLPFYSGTSLLQAGLSDYSVELGAVRRNYAIDSLAYGDALASGTYRRGLSDAFTLELHGESLLSQQHAAGANLAARVGNFGIVSATLANGRDSDASGWLGGFGFERSSQRLSFALRTQFSSAGFRQPGDDLTILRTKQQSFAQVGWSAGRAGTLSLAYGVQTFRELPSSRTISVSHNISLRDIGYLSLSASHTQSVNEATNVFLIFTMPLSNRRTASMSARYDNDDLGRDRELLGTMQKSAPLGTGNGYRMQASTRGNYQLGWTGNYEQASIELEAARYLGTAAQRATLTGGATFLGGEVRTTRSVNDSFALVEVPGVPDVTVYVDNQPVAQTDANGRALVRNLRAYDRNRVSVDPAQLPLDTRIESQSMLIAPAFRSGSTVVFPVTRERGATFRVVFPDGRPLPAGSIVALGSRQFPVAMNGYVYVADYDHGMKATATWSGGTCEFRLDPPPSNDPLPDLGIVQCRVRP